MRRYVEWVSSAIRLLVIAITAAITGGSLPFRFRVRCVRCEELSEGAMRRDWWLVLAGIGQPLRVGPV